MVKLPFCGRNVTCDVKYINQVYVMHEDSLACWQFPRIHHEVTAKPTKPTKPSPISSV